MRLPHGYGRRRTLSQNLARIAWSLCIILPLAIVLGVRDGIKNRWPTAWVIISEPAVIAAVLVLLLIESLPWPRQ